MNLLSTSTYIAIVGYMNGLIHFSDIYDIVIML